MTESSSDAIVALALDGSIASWNAGAERLYGYPAEEVVGRPLSNLFEGTLLDDRLISEFASGRQRVACFDARHLRADGSLVEASVSVLPVESDAGQVEGLLCVARDVGEQRQAERDAAHAQRRFEKAFEASPVGMALVAVDGRWLAVNESLCRVLGRDEAELRKMTFQALTHPEDLDSDLALLSETLRGERDSYELDKRYVRADGSVVWAHLGVALLRDDSGAPLYFLSQVQDITERRQAEDQLRRYAKHLQDLARVDPVTGLRTHRDFESLLDTEFERSLRYRSVWSVAYLEIDDPDGPEDPGDEVDTDRSLKEVAAILREEVRDADVVARSGNGFGLILTSASGAEAEGSARRMAAAAAEVGARLSYGVASWPADGSSKEAVLECAAARLEARKAGSSTGPQVIPARETLIDAPSIVCALEMAREQLGMDVAYLARVEDDSQHVQCLCGDGSPFGLRRGSVRELEGTPAGLALEAPGAQLATSVAQRPELVRRLATGGRVESYAAVQVSLPDGDPYGVLCALSQGPSPDLDELSLRLLRSLADLTGREIARGDQEAVARRTQAELAGVEALLSALLARDHYTGEHSHNVVQLARAVAQRLGLERAQVTEVEEVALLHDIGKVGIPDAVLQKPGSLDEGEWELMCQHPVIGARILLGTETLSRLAPGVRAEHERFDGRGYPDGLRGESIPLASRITFACDAYHAMTSDRPYRDALSEAVALQELREGAGSQFDPRVVEALLAVLDDQPRGDPHAAAGRDRWCEAVHTASEEG